MIILNLKERKMANSSIQFGIEIGFGYGRVAIRAKSIWRYVNVGR